MLQYHLAKYKSNFEIDFLFVVYLSKRQNNKKKSQLTATLLDLLRMGSNLHCILTNIRSSMKIHLQTPKIYSGVMAKTPLLHSSR